MEFNPTIFGSGLGIGLIVAFIVWFNKWRAGAVTRRELEDLKKHLQTQLSINAKGYEEMQQDIARLKRENENLRITVATLSNKPGRAELKTLQVWDKALHLMTATSPGFAPAWEMAIAEANKEMQDIDTGMKAFVRRVFPILPPELSSHRTDEAAFHKVD